MKIRKGEERVDVYVPVCISEVDSEVAVPN